MSRFGKLWTRNYVPWHTDCQSHLNYCLADNAQEDEMLPTILVGALAIGSAGAKVITCSAPTVPIRSHAEYVAGVPGKIETTSEGKGENVPTELELGAYGS
jgi:hypothetical protein